MVILIEVNEQIRNCYKSLLPYFNQNQPLPESILETKFKELLYTILIDPANRNVLAYINSIVEGYETPVWEIMESNYMYDLKIAEYAQLANRSKATFKRDFENYYHTTPGKWLTKKRLERSRLLLETSKIQIGEVVFKCGFNNISHFSRIFKERYGASPLNYRKSVQKS